MFERSLPFVARMENKRAILRSMDIINACRKTRINVLVSRLFGEL